MIRPDISFILADGLVHRIVYDSQETGDIESTYAGRVTDIEGKTSKIDDFLKSLGKTPLGKRYAVLGFGSNPVPGQLVSKFGADAVVPVIYGEISNTDVVYNLINEGYAFAELALKQQGVNVSVAITFLDSKQLKSMNETEEPNYHLAFIPQDVHLISGEVVSGGMEDVPGLFYAGARKIWVPEHCDGPIAIAEISRTGRPNIALTQVQTLDLIVKEFKLWEEGIMSGTELSERLIKEGKGKKHPIKDYLRNCVADDSRSLKSVESQVTPLKNPKTPPKMFGDN